VAGEQGVLRADLIPTPTLEHNGDPVRVPASRLGEVEDYGFVAQHRAFAADFAAGREPVTNARFGRHVLEIVCAAYESAAAGAPEPLPFRGQRDRTPLQLWHEAGS
jgi:predicted dehydrogenase